MIIMILSMQSYAESTLFNWAIGHSLRILQFIEIMINQNFVVNNYKMMCMVTFTILILMIMTIEFIIIASTIDLFIIIFIILLSEFQM